MKITSLNKIETTTCSRCLGSGAYSYHTEHGDRCFKCQGKGETYTKRGLVTLAYLRSLRVSKKSVENLNVGDVILFSYFNGVGIKSVWTEIKTILIGNGSVEITTAEGLTQSNLVGHEYEFRLHSITDAETLAKALEFQATLNKSGNPFKK